MKTIKPIAVAVLFLSIWGIRTAPALENAISISIPIGDKTEIHSVQPDGKRIKTAVVNGTMPKVSPDGRSIAYLEQTGLSASDGPVFELAIADRDGKKIRNLPTFLFPEHKDQMRVAKFSWSPDSKKIAVVVYLVGVVLKDNLRHIVLLNVVDVKTGKMKQAHKSNFLSLRETSISNVEWFSDSNRILFSNTRTITLIDVDQKSSKTLIEQGFSPKLFDNEKRVIYLVKNSLDPASAVSIWRYSMKNNKKEKILDSGLSLVTFSLNRAKDKLIFQGVPSPPKPGERSPRLYLLDITRKKLDHIFLPKEREIFCPQFLSKDNLISCFGLDAKNELAGYFVLDLRTKSLTLLNKIENVEKSRSFRMLMGFCDEVN